MELRNNMACFPIFIDIKQKKCLIVGGGKVAIRKVETLLRYGACVYVVAEQICEDICEKLPSAQRRTGHVTETDIEQSVLVIAATSSRETNHRIAELCHSRNIPVNVIDAPEECTFIFPAVVQKGDVSIGINTGGKSPILSQKIRKTIEADIPDYYADLADQLGDLREYVKVHFKDEKDRRRILKSVAAEAFAQERTLSREEINEIIRQDKK